MKRARRAALAHHAGLGLLLLLLYAAHGRMGSDAATDPSPVTTADVEKAIRRWSAGPRATAERMMAEYGPPDRASWRALRWKDNAPWVKTVVHHSAFPRLLGPRKRDWLEQTAAFVVPVRAESDLHAFDERIEINSSAGQVSSLSPDEATNTLLLNLAYEVATGRRDVRSAREFAARTEALEKAGKSSVYTRGLLFLPRSKRSHAPAMVPGRPRGYTEPQKGGSHE